MLTHHSSVLAKSCGWLTASFPLARPIFFLFSPLVHNGHNSVRTRRFPFSPTRRRNRPAHAQITPEASSAASELSVHFDFVPNVVLDGLPPSTSQLRLHNFKIKAQAPRRIKAKGHCSVVQSLFLFESLFLASNSKEKKNS